MWPIRSNGPAMLCLPTSGANKSLPNSKASLGRETISLDEMMKWRRIPSIFRIPSMTVPKAFIDPNLQVSG